MKKINIKAISTEESSQQKKQQVHLSLLRRTSNFINGLDNHLPLKPLMFNGISAILITTLIWCGIDNCLSGSRLNTYATLEYNTSLNAIQTDILQGNKLTTEAIDKITKNTLKHDGYLLNPIIPIDLKELATAALTKVIRHDCNEKFRLTTTPILYISDKYNVNKYISTKRHSNNDNIGGVLEIIVAGLISISTIFINLLEQ